MDFKFIIKIYNQVKYVNIVPLYSSETSKFSPGLKLYKLALIDSFTCDTIQKFEESGFTDCTSSLEEQALKFLFTWKN